MVQVHLGFLRIDPKQKVSSFPFHKATAIIKFNNTLSPSKTVHQWSTS